VYCVLSPVFVDELFVLRLHWHSLIYSCFPSRFISRSVCPVTVCTVNKWIEPIHNSPLDYFRTCVTHGNWRRLHSAALRAFGCDKRRSEKSPVYVLCPTVICIYYSLLLLDRRRLLMFVYQDIYIKKAKWSRYRPGVAQRVGRGIALLWYCKPQAYPTDWGTRRG